MNILFQVVLEVPLTYNPLNIVPNFIYGVEGWITNYAVLLCIILPLLRPGVKVPLLLSYCIYI